MKNDGENPASEKGSSVLAFLNERRQWLTVRTVPSEGGHGFDVVLVLDGSYTFANDAEDMARFMSEVLSEAMRSDGLAPVGVQS